MEPISYIVANVGPRRRRGHGLPLIPSQVCSMLSPYSLLSVASLGVSFAKDQMQYSCPKTVPNFKGTFSRTCLILFLDIQRDHMPHKIIAPSLLEHSIGSKRSLAHVNGCKARNLTPVSVLACSQDNSVVVQSPRTCLIDSSSAPPPTHTSQYAMGSMCLRFKIWRVSRNSFGTLHQKTRTLGGTQRFHTHTAIIDQWILMPGWHPVAIGDNGTEVCRLTL
jgi:hypothetical protein